MHSKIILLAILIAVCSCSTKTETTGDADSIPSLDSAYNQPVIDNQRVATDDPVFDLYNRIVDLITQKDISTAKKLILENKAALLDFEKTKTPVYMPGTFLYQFSDDEDIVEFLLEQGFDPNIATYFPGEEGSDRNEYPTPCNRQSAELLIEAGSQFALDGLMKCAVSEKDVSQIRNLLKRKADQLPAIPLACELQDHDLLRELIESGAGTNEALYWSVQNGDVEMIKELLGKGARLTRSELDPWGMPSILATKNKEIRNLVAPVVDGTLFSEIHGGEGFCDGSYLISASIEGDIETVEFMLMAGADPNQFCWEDPDGNFDCNRASALGGAESNGNEEMIALLKKYKAEKPEKCD